MQHSPSCCKRDRVCISTRAIPSITCPNGAAVRACNGRVFRWLLTNLNQCVPLAGEIIQGKALRSEVVCVFCACEGLHSPSVNTERFGRKFLVFFAHPINNLAIAAT